MLVIFLNVFSSLTCLHDTKFSTIDPSMEAADFDLDDVIHPPII
jgi:hypothetical protein